MDKSFRNAIGSIGLAAVLACAAAMPASAQKPSIYPAKNQTAEKQASDDASCQAWAKKDTGIDPAAIAAAPAPAPQGPQGQRLRGAARGAAAGAVIGGIANDDAGKGAAVGATAGVVAGGARARRSQAAAVQQAQASTTNAMGTYHRAYGACMQGRGYSVK